MNREIHLSTSHEPAVNHAYEEYLYHDHNLSHKTIFFLYINKPSIIIGKNQHPDNECCMLDLFMNRMKLIRRITGGGAVFHDYGNLNYSIISNKINFNKLFQLDLIKSFLIQLGYKARIKNNEHIFIDNKKVSGNAFAFGKNRVLHHGTILVNTDISLMNKTLIASQDNKYKGIKSNPSPVVNLNDINKIKMSFVTEEFIHYLMTHLHCKNFNKLNPKSIDCEEYMSLLDKYSSMEWNYFYGPVSKEMKIKGNVQNKSEQNLFQDYIKNKNNYKLRDFIKQR